MVGTKQVQEVTHNHEITCDQNSMWLQARGKILDAFIVNAQHV